MNILLVNPSIDKKKIMTITPPLGILYIAAVLKKKYQVKFLDLDVLKLNKKKITKFISHFRPRIIGITSNILQVPSTYELAQFIKTTFPSILIIVGGPAFAVDGKKILSQCKHIDIIIKSEGEETVVELVKSIEKNEPVNHIQGIIFRENFALIETQNRGLIKDVSKIPFPAYELIEWFKMYPGYPLFPLMSSRGCPFRCIFCSNPVWGKTYRRRSLDNIISEIQFLIHNYNASYFDFHEDTFNLNYCKALLLCKEIIKVGLNKKIRWKCACRVNEKLISQELFKNMKEAGCDLVSFGIESGNEKVLKSIKKDITLDEVKKAINLAKKNKLKVKGYFMIGHLNETKYNAFDTIRFAENLPLDCLQFTIYTPFPGSEYYNIALGKNLIKSWNYGKYSQHQATVRTDKLNILDLECLYALANIRNQSKINPSQSKQIVSRIKNKIYQYLRIWRFILRHNFPLIKMYFEYLSYIKNENINIQ